MSRTSVMYSMRGDCSRTRVVSSMGQYACTADNKLPSPSREKVICSTTAALLG